MPTFVYVLFSIVVAAIIGGVTNYLAIKMLFHPRQPLYLFGKHLPFTPGLIPKRKEEIANSLGDVVGDHLITSDGLRSVLNDEHFRQQIKMKIEAFVETLANRRDSMEEEWIRRWGDQQIEAIKRRWNEQAGRIIRWGIDWLWEEREWKHQRIAQIIPDWNEEVRSRLVGKTTEAIMTMLHNELASVNGDRLIRQMTAQWLGQTRGVIGTLAQMFMDEEKISRKIRQTVMEQLHSPFVRSKIHQLIEGKVMEWEQWSLAQLVENVTEEEAKEWLFRQTEKLNFQGWLDPLWQCSMKELLSGGRKEALLEKIPGAVDWFLKLISSHLEQIIISLDLPKLVRQQVSSFPIEQLERVVLSVSGREFRAITWLGALLGGFIGLIQAVFYVLSTQ